MLYFSSAQTQLTQFAHRLQIDDFLSSDQCRQIIDIMRDTKLIEALVSEEGVKNTSIRSTKLCALEFNQDTKWVFHKLEEAIMQVNSEVFKFDLVGIDEPVQLMRYDVGDHYGPHMDTGALVFSRRKISFTVQLTDPSHYKGGDLEFFQTGLAPRERGTLILFPSYLYHWIRPVTKGTRRALVGWVCGNPLR